MLTVFEIRLQRWTDARGRTKRRAPVVDRKAGDVKRHAARVRLSLDHDEHGTSVGAGPEYDAAAAREIRTGRAHLPGLRPTTTRRFAAGHVSSPPAQDRPRRSLL